MVNVGGPSKGCLTCIQRKIRVRLSMLRGFRDALNDKLIVLHSVTASDRSVANVRKATEDVEAIGMKRISCFEINRRLSSTKDLQHRVFKP